MEPSEHVDVGGSSSVPTDASVDVSKATESIPTEDPHCVSPDVSDQVPSEKPSAGPLPDTSFPSTPGTRKKTIGKKRKVSKGESPKDSTFIDFDSDDENPVVWERIVKWKLLTLKLVKDKSMYFTDKMVPPKNLIF